MSGLHHVAHRVQARLLTDYPSRGLDGSSGESRAGVRLMLYLNTLPLAGEEHRMVTDDVPAPDGVDAYLIAPGGDALPAIDQPGLLA